jgi:AcrR family transcriptional regulator
MFPLKAKDQPSNISATKANVRQRRTPQEARELILESAQKRLSDHGVRGLNIKDIASDTHINHGTLLHHFGSAEGMRNALLSRMTDQLISAMGDILESNPGPEAIIEALFDLMTSTGHIKLLAWRAMEDSNISDISMPAAGSETVRSIINKITEGLSDRDQQTARNMVFLAVSTAVGWGICGSGFQQIFGLSPTQQEDFPRWVGIQMAKLNRSD